MNRKPVFGRGRALALFLFFVSGTLGSVWGEERKPLRIHCLSGSKEYKSEESLKILIADLKERYVGVTCTASWGKDKGKSLDNLEPLKQADLMVVFCRRQDLPEEQMEIIRAHYEGGKPVLGIRTASHPFQQEDNAHFDRVVLGNNYDGHYGNEPFEVVTAGSGKGHPVLAGVGAFRSHRLYKEKELPKTTVVLQTGDIGKGVHPVTIVNEYKGARIFYTSLGMPEDFRKEPFLKMLRNAVFWTTERVEEDYEKGQAPAGKR